MARIRKTTAIISALGILGAIFLTAFTILTVDARPPDDSDLIPVRRSVPRSENGFLIYKQAVAKATFKRHEVTRSG